MSQCPKPEKIQAYADGELRGTEAEVIASHLQSCPHCQTLYDWLLRITEGLRAGSRPAAPSELLPRIHDAVEAAAPVAQILCPHAQSLISPYLDGELAPAEQLLLWRHIFVCEQCYQELKQTEEITAVLRRQVVPVPAGLAARVHNAVDSEIARQKAGAARLVRQRIRRRVVGVATAGLAAAAALLVALLLGPETPVTERPRIAETPLAVTQPAEEPAAPEVAVTAEPEVKQPKVAAPVTPHPRPVSGRRLAAVSRTRPHPARSERPTDEGGARRVATSEGSASSEATARPSSSDLAPVGSEAPRPVSPVPPPTDTEAGPRLALRPPAILPTAPPPESVRFTPVASPSETIYSNPGAVADSALIAASAQVNKRVELDMMYAVRPAVTLK